MEMWLGMVATSTFLEVKPCFLFQLQSPHAFIYRNAHINSVIPILEVNVCLTSDTGKNITGVNLAGKSDIITGRETLFIGLVDFIALFGQVDRLANVTKLSVQCTDCIVRIVQDHIPVPVYV